MDPAGELAPDVARERPMAVKSSVTVCLFPEGKGGPFILWDDLPAALEQAAALGFDAVELFPPDPGALDPSGLGDLLTRYRLEVSTVGSASGKLRHRLSLTNADTERRDQAREFVRSMIDFAAAVGAPVIVGSMQGFWDEAVSRERALDLLADALNDLGEHASSRGQVLLYEPLNRYETNLINTVTDGVRFLDTLSTRSVRLLADLYHMNIEEADIGGAIRHAGGHLGHVHFNDSNRRPAGLGHVDYGPVVAALREIGYAGYLAAEALPYPSPSEAARQTATKFRELFAT